MTFALERCIWAHSRRFATPTCMGCRIWGSTCTGRHTTRTHETWWDCSMLVPREQRTADLQWCCLAGDGQSRWLHVWETWTGIDPGILDQRLNSYETCDRYGWWFLEGYNMLQHLLPSQVRSRWQLFVWYNLPRIHSGMITELFRTWLGKRNAWSSMSAFSQHQWRSGTTSSERSVCGKLVCSTSLREPSSDTSCHAIARHLPRLKFKKPPRQSDLHPGISTFVASLVDPRILVEHWGSLASRQRTMPTS